MLKVTLKVIEKRQLSYKAKKKKIRIKVRVLSYRCNLAPLNRNTAILFKSDIAYIVITALYNILGGYLGTPRISRR